MCSACSLHIKSKQHVVSCSRYLFSVLCIEFAAVVKEEEFPEFYGWVERMKGTDAVKGSYQPPEAHLAFIKSVKAGVHDYIRNARWASGGW